jgi:hypothetical protein
MMKKSTEITMNTLNRLASRLLAALALLLLVQVAQAHHSFAVHFVADQLVTLKGTVTSYRFTNPHGMVFFTITKEDGSVEEWRAETNSPNALRRRGWTKDSIQVGDEVTIVGFPTRDGTPYVRISKLTFADGRELHGQAPAEQD